jgi:hypothetical protein
MKKTSIRNPKSRRPKVKTRLAEQTVNCRVPEEALSFFRHNWEFASSSILSHLRELSQGKQTAIEHYAMRVLKMKQLKQEEPLRSGAIRLIIAMLPKTFPTLKELLSDSSSPLWYEVQFTAFCALDRDDLTEADQERVLALVEDYLMNVKSGAGYATWKAGDLLGDEWNTPGTVQLLEKLLFSAKHVTGRKAAIHGIQHAILKAAPSERKRLFALMSKVTSEDRSANVRAYANSTLKGFGCHHISADSANSNNVREAS